MYLIHNAEYTILKKNGFERLIYNIRGYWVARPNITKKENPLRCAFRISLTEYTLISCDIQKYTLVIPSARYMVFGLPSASLASSPLIWSLLFMKGNLREKEKFFFFLSTVLELEAKDSEEPFPENTTFFNLGTGSDETLASSIPLELPTKDYQAQRRCNWPRPFLSLHSSFTGYNSGRAFLLRGTVWSDIGDAPRLPPFIIRCIHHVKDIAVFKWKTWKWYETT